jgi:pyrroline-5-carboxylate reductase
MSGNDESSTIAFIGGGNMARSLAGGLLRGGADAATIRVAEPNAELRASLAKDFGIETTDDNAVAARASDVWVLAVKPQVMKTVCVALREAASEKKPLVISIAAGIRIGQLSQWLGGNASVVRCMPNTPALIGAGASALCANERVDAKQRKAAEQILGAAGTVEWVHDEAMMDTVTALSGSGPAYFFLLVEAMENAAVAQGLPRETARSLAIQTCLGAGRMLREAHEAPADLRKRVTSPGGTTAAAIEAFADGGFQALVARAIADATTRGGELSAQFGD